MEAKDFRIGNMVSYYHPEVEGIDPLIGHVMNIDEEDIMVAEYQDVSLKSYTIGGVFLTLEWLKKLGFKHSSHFGNGYLLNNLVLAGDKENKKFYLIDTSRRPSQIKYLHQLQNLYFDIHGVELSYENLSEVRLAS